MYRLWITSSSETKVTTAFRKKDSCKERRKMGMEKENVERNCMDYIMSCENILRLPDPEYYEADEAVKKLFDRAISSGRERKNA